MYQTKKQLTGIGLYFLDKNYVYTTSRSIQNTVITRYDTDIQPVLQTTVNFSGFVNAEAAVYFTDNVNFKTGVIAKSDFRVMYDDHYLINLNAGSVTSDCKAYVGNIREKGFCLYSLEQMHIEKLFTQEINKHFIQTTAHGFLKYGGFETPGFVAFCDYDHHQLWQATGLAERGRYQDIMGKSKAAKISGVQLYEDSVIVMAGRVMIRYELLTGKVIWELENEKWAFAKHLLIDGYAGYSNGGTGYVTIDLQNGKFINNVGELKSLTVSGKTIIPAGRELVLHDGLLWHAISDSGMNIIAAIQPGTGDYAWYLPLDVAGRIEAPKFHQKSMYILSSEGDLLVLERS